MVWCVGRVVSPSDSKDMGDSYDLEVLRSTSCERFNKVAGQVYMVWAEYT